MTPPHTPEGYPRRGRDGHLVPWLADWMRGNREADQLQARGLTLDRSQASLAVLGRAVADQEPDPERDQHLAALVDQLQARNRVERARLETAPEESVRTAPERIENEPERGLDDGQGHSAARAQDKNADRNEKIDPITEYLEKVPDPPDEEWS